MQPEINNVHTMSDSTSDLGTVMPNLNTQNDRFKFLLSEIKENEDKIAQIKSTLQSLENMKN